MLFLTVLVRSLRSRFGVWVTPRLLFRKLSENDLI
nr:MAG TPA: hypothetical protein [Caudoviricetes sp.]